MKKLILPIFLLLLSVFSSSVHAASDLSGSWSGFGYSFKAAQSGNSLTLTATDGDIKGKVSFEGTITGDTLQGRQILIAKSCPNLEKYVPASGTISSDGNSITVTYKNSDYDPVKCVDLPGNQSEETGSYTKVSGPPASTKPPPPTQTPQAKKATPTLPSLPTTTSVPSAEKVDQLPQKQDQLDQNQSESKENLFIKALGGFPVFIGEWFKAVTTGWGMGEFFYQSMALGDEVLRSKDIREIAEEKAAREEKYKIEAQQKLEDYFDKQGLAELDQVLNRIPVIKDIPNQKAGQWQQESPFRLDILNGRAQIKYPGESQWRDIKVGDQIPNGSTLFTGMDTTTVLSIQNKGVVQVLPFTEITISEWGLEQATLEKQTTTDIKLEKGEIEVNIESLDNGIMTPSVPVQVEAYHYTVGVRGTHFWVSQAGKVGSSVVGVYKGKVEVKTKDGKITTVTPSGDPSTGSGQSKPGVFMVAQKLSVVKLIIAGALLTAILGGVVLILKKRVFSRSLSKKR